MRDITTWLSGRWVAGAGFMVLALLAILPLLKAAFALPLVLIFLHSPGYMLHQVEEHSGDRFRTFVNQRIFGGRNVLSTAAVLVINMPLVWGLNMTALYAAWMCGPGFGLVSPYAMLVNALIHISAALRLRCYNPGLATSLLLFLPLSVWTLIETGPVAARFHLAGLGIAIILHLLIIGYLLLRARRNVA